MNRVVRCFDKFKAEILEGDIVYVQKAGKTKVYTKKDGQLYFQPYKKEERVSHYFPNDLIKQ